MIILQTGQNKVGGENDGNQIRLKGRTIGQRVNIQCAQRKTKATKQNRNENIERVK